MCFIDLDMLELDKFVIILARAKFIYMCLVIS